VADRGRLAQALGNLLANAAEHGVGAVELSGRPVGGGVRVEVRNSVAGAGPGAYSGKEGREGAVDRGRGLAVARAAARELGGRLEVSLDGGEAVATLDLPGAAGAVLPNGRPATTREGSGRAGAGSPAVLPNGRAATASQDSGRAAAGEGAVLIRGAPATTDQHGGEGEARAA
jgi:hypothetical protein